MILFRHLDDGYPELEARVLGVGVGTECESRPIGLRHLLEPNEAASPFKLGTDRPTPGVLEIVSVTRALLGVLKVDVAIHPDIFSSGGLHGKGVNIVVYNVDKCTCTSIVSRPLI